MMLIKSKLTFLFVLPILVSCTPGNVYILGKNLEGESLPSKDIVSCNSVMGKAKKVADQIGSLTKTLGSESCKSNIKNRPSCIKVKKEVCNMNPEQKKTANELLVMCANHSQKNDIRFLANLMKESSKILDKKCSL